MLCRHAEHSTNLDPKSVPEGISLLNLTAILLGNCCASDISMFREKTRTQTTNKTWTSFEGSSILMSSFYADFRCNFYVQVSPRLILIQRLSVFNSQGRTLDMRLSWWCFRLTSLTHLHKNCLLEGIVTSPVCTINFSGETAVKGNFISSHNFYALIFTKGKRLIKVPLRTCSSNASMAHEYHATTASWLLNTQTISSQIKNFKRGVRVISCVGLLCLCTQSLRWRVRWILLNMKVEYKLWWSERKQWLTRKKDMSYKELLSKEKGQT